MISKPELLAPAGDRQKLEMALRYGADAVYVGGERFSLRAQAANFDLEGLAEAVTYTHAQGKKLYLALNIYAHQEDLDTLPEYLRQVAQIGPDALIISDLGVLALAREYAPELALHISTQANTVNWRTAEVWRSLGARRVILGRELSLAEIEMLTSRVSLETEIFVHGAMCMSYSGRCLLSNYLTGRDANRGDCAQSCRWQYALLEEKRPGQYLPIEEDARGSYILNSRDLCLLPRLGQIVQSGVSALKIEGRNKSAYYVANVVRIYRAALDAAWVEGQAYQPRPAWLDELEKISHREYTTGFLLEQPGPQLQRYETADPLRGYDFAATLEEVEPGRLRLEQRNNVRLGDILEILLPDGRNLNCPVEALTDTEGQVITAAAHARQTFYLPAKPLLLSQLAGQSLPLIVRRAARVSPAK